MTHIKCHWVPANPGFNHEVDLFLRTKAKVDDFEGIIMTHKQYEHIQLTSFSKMKVNLAA